MVSDHFIVLKSGRVLRKKNLSELILIHVEDYLLCYEFMHEEKLSVCGKMKEIMEQLPEGFIQISRSKVVNADHVVEVYLKNRRLKLSDGSWHIISTRRLRGVLNFLGNR